VASPPKITSPMGGASGGASAKPGQSWCRPQGFSSIRGAREKAGMTKLHSGKAQNKTISVLGGGASRR